MRLNQKRFVATPRGRFHVRMTPEEGYPVVMLHGWPETSYCWTRVTEQLDAQFQVIAPDLRGLGDSERTQDESSYRKQALAQDMLSLLDTLGIERCHLIGHDWGGVVAQEMALADPQRINRLVIMNIVLINNLKGNMEVIEKVRTSGSSHYWYQHFQQQKHLPEHMIPGNEEVWLNHFLRFWSGESFPEDAFHEFVRCYRIPGTPASGASYYRTFQEDARRWVGLAGETFPMPSLYILGDKDPVIIPEYLNHAEECFDDLEIERIEAGHFVQEEQPGKVARCLNDFLD